MCGNLQDATSRCVKDTGRFKIGFLDPLKIAQCSFTYEPSVEDKAKLSAKELLSKKKTNKDEKKNDIIDYITRVFLNSQDKNLICAPYNFA